MRKWSESPGDFIYRSDRKLASLTAQLGVRTGSWDPDLEIEAGAGVKAGVPPVGNVSASGAVRASRSDPGSHQKIVARQLAQVSERLGGDRLPDLDSGEGEVRDGGWFRFHRSLRFGIGHADAMPSFKALLLVDEAPVSEGLAF